jgi:hypothetical protein
MGTILLRTAGSNYRMMPNVPSGTDRAMDPR